MSRLLVYCAAGAALLTGHNVDAGTFGPFLDAKHLIEAPSGIVITFTFPTEHKVSGPISNPPPNVGDIVKDKITYTIEIPFFDSARSVNVGGAAWHTVEEPDNGFRQITTLYGVDLDPNGDSVHLTGFDADLASALTFYDETIIGASGILYPAVSLGTPTLAELPALLPGFDLSAFEGDPSSIVYVFQATVPHSDIVPEPSSVVLALAGLMSLSALVYRRIS